MTGPNKPQIAGKPSAARVLFAAGALMWLIPVTVMLALLLGLVLWAVAGWAGIAITAALLVWGIVAMTRRRSG